MFSYGLLHIDMPVLVNQQKNYIHQFCLNSGCHLDDIPRVMANKDGWQERFKVICATSMMMMMMMMKFKIIEKIHFCTLNYWKPYLLN